MVPDWLFSLDFLWLLSPDANNHYLALFYWEEKHKDLKTKDKVTILLDLLTHQADRVNLDRFSSRPMPFDMKGILDS